MRLYGIKHCDSVKKAIRQLDENGVDYDFIDLKSTKLPADLLLEWLTKLPDTLVNKRSITYRRLKDAWLAADSQAARIQLIQANPTLLKRPLIVNDEGQLSVGLEGIIK